jgi:two-component system, NtrC family, response regulator HydG
MNKKYSKILIIDDNEDVLFAAKLLLKPVAGIVVTEKNPDMIPQLLANDSFDVIFLDMNFSKDVMSGQEGFYWLNEILKIDPAAVVILITAYGDIETAVRAVKEGAVDFVLKPWQNEKFLSTFNAAVKLKNSIDEVSKLKERQKAIVDSNGSFEMIGSSPVMQKVFNTINKVATTDANVLILGENGTGKELVAKALHKKSLRKDDVFISVDMGAVSRTLFESELFGHIKGAYTDAREDRAGRFELASGGTLFLDEIGNLTPELQAKLLNVLQNRQVARLGSNIYKSIDIRLICATNMPIYKMVESKEFRQDLLYRINTVEIQLPPLRERGEDIKILSEFFLDIYKRKYKKENLRITSAAMKRFENYSWPGNVRELQHTIERCIIMSESDKLEPADLLLSGKEEKENELQFENYNLDDIEKTVIQKIISKYEGNITKAAKELGLTRTSLYRRMEKHGI